MSLSEIRSTEATVEATCLDCPLTEHTQHPQELVRRHVAETGHQVQIRRTRTTTYGPKHPAETKELQNA